MSNVRPLVFCFLLAHLGWPMATAFGQTDRPRFVILLDNSASMSQDLTGLQTHGDGSETQPGCNIDGKSTAGWAYDDSKLYQAKQAIVDTISAFGSAEFALSTYSRILLGQRCTAHAECNAISAGSQCVDVPNDPLPDKFCAYPGGDTYKECSAGGGCVACSNGSDTHEFVFDMRAFDCEFFRCSFSAGCVGGQVLVGFPTATTSNLTDIYRWIDGKEDAPPFAATSNREIRASTLTPIASAIDSVRAWLVDPTRTDIGPSPGLVAKSGPSRDPRLECRPYNIILITDGEDTCSPNGTNDPVQAAVAAVAAGINVYVVAFGTGMSTSLNSLAMAGSGRNAYFPANRGELTATLGDIILQAMPKAKCTCGAGCSDDIYAFPTKGQSCQVGVGRCKRQGTTNCNATGDGLLCMPEGICGGAALQPGTPGAETCGVTAGCLAPTAADCADENCDGQIDENLSCDCPAQPEICNGKDDNCDGAIDNIAVTACGKKMGVCQEGRLACEKKATGEFVTICTGSVGPSTEICDGLDNDCDGMVDALERPCFPTAGLGCQAGEAALTWTCQGACATGKERCEKGTWQSCVGARVAVSEVECDLLDNDCDGAVDEGGPASTPICYPPKAVGCDVASGLCVGECALGKVQCAGARIGTTCVGAKVPAQEKCNGKDDDCDGKVDEEFPSLGKKCNEKSCQGAGEFVCNTQGTDVECNVAAEGPSPEICDGRDNDCDGQVDEPPSAAEPAMPGVGLPCGSDIGECRKGVSTCTAGKIVCGGVNPIPELCDGKDNDCNGSVDDSAVPPAVKCNPEGIPAGTSLVGECREGRFQCMGASGWKCAGGLGPKAEVCDGKDNDCDGQIDNQAPCTDGFVCLEGECVPRCSLTGENSYCPPDRTCVEGICRVKACVRQPCTAGMVCQKDGMCVDPCAGVDCLEGAVCVSGTCVDCYRTGCPQGTRCIARRCTQDACDTIKCAASEYCLDGNCLPSCGTVQCGPLQTCIQGQCVATACPSGCAIGHFCSQANATCMLRLCAGIQCPSGLVCQESTGTCIANPCERVHCPVGQLCTVGGDGEPICELPYIKPALPVEGKGKGNGLFGCRVAAQSGSGDRPWLGFAILAVFGLWQIRRRRRG